MNFSKQIVNMPAYPSCYLQELMQLLRNCKMRMNDGSLTSTIIIKWNADMKRTRREYNNLGGIVW